MNFYDLIVIGGGAAGFTAALTAKKFNFKAKILLISKEKEFYSRCSLPFVLSGEIENFEKISHSIQELCEQSGIDCIIDEDVAINTGDRIVETKKKEKFSYNSLIIATGSFAFVPKIEGVEKEGVFTLKSVEDAKKILKYAKKSKSAIVIGGGAIGVEISAALKKLGLEVTVIELLPSVLPTCFSEDFSEIIKNKLKGEGIKVITNSSVEKILGEKKVTGALVSGQEISADMIVIGVGVKPNVKLAQDSGIKVDKGILVNERMATSTPGIYAAGDCVISKSLINGKPILSQLGTTAIRQGKIAGVNALGGNETLEGVLNSIVLKIFDLVVGSTGLTEEGAKREGFQIVTGKIRTLTKEDYVPGTKELWVKLIFKQEDKRVLGAEIIGGEMVAQKVDLIALAIQKGATLRDILNLDYCYTPPLISAHNALVLAAENAQRKLRRIKGKM